MGKLKSKYGDWAISGENAVTPQYNTKLVSAAEAPKSWGDLLDPKWKGKIGITTDMKVWTTLALEEGGSASPSSGTRMAKELEGLPVVYQTEEGIVKAIDMGLDKRFSKLLGLAQD